MDQTSPEKLYQHDYEFFLADGTPPASDSSLEDINHAVYPYGTLIGISDEVDLLIGGRAPYCYLDSCEQVYQLTNTARRHQRKLTQVPSVVEAAKIAYSYHQRERIEGLASLSAAIVHDIVAPPYHLSQMAIARLRSRFALKKANAGILDEVLESLGLSWTAAVTLVVTLGLEPREAVERQFLNGEVYMFLVIARLLEAYGSRHAPSGTVFLISHKRLPKEHCSGIARLHFEQIYGLKKALILAGLFPAQNLDPSEPLERCLRKVYPALKGTFADSDEEPGFSHIVQMLRHIQDEMQRLIPIMVLCDGLWGLPRSRIYSGHVCE